VHRIWRVLLHRLERLMLDDLEAAAAGENAHFQQLLQGPEILVPCWRAVVAEAGLPAG